MSSFHDNAENKLIDWLFRAQAVGFNGASAGAGSGPATLYVGLLNTTPTDSTSGTEVSGSGYARVAVTSSLANWAGTQGAGTTTASTGSGGTTSNNNAITFPTPGAGGWSNVAGVALYDAPTGGNIVIYMALTVAKTVNQGDTVSFPAGTLTFQIDN